VAELVANRASKMNKRVLAMGGAKNHLVALPDCEVESAASDIVASFAGCAGQRCMVRLGFGLVEFWCSEFELLVFYQRLPYVLLARAVASTIIPRHLCISLLSRSLTS